MARIVVGLRCCLSAGYSTVYAESGKKMDLNALPPPHQHDGKSTSPTSNEPVPVQTNPNLNPVTNNPSAHVDADKQDATAPPRITPLQVPPLKPTSPRGICIIAITMSAQMIDNMLYVLFCYSFLRLHPQEGRKCTADGRFDFDRVVRVIVIAR